MGGAGGARGAKDPSCGELLDPDDRSQCGLDGCDEACFPAVHCSDEEPCSAGSCVDGYCAAPLSGTHPGGLALTPSELPYVLTGDVQVAGDLTVAPGSILIGNGNTLRVSGALSILGTSSARTRLVGVHIDAGSVDPDAPSAVEVSHVDMYGGSLLRATGGERYFGFFLGDSRLTGLESLYLWYPIGQVDIERNVFVDMEAISIGVTEADGAQVRIRHNYFEGLVIDAGTPQHWIVVWATYGSAGVSLGYNTFAGSHGVVALEYDASNVTAEDNYWGTTDPAAIATRIRDQNDEIDLAAVIPFTPFLTAPHPATPTRTSAPSSDPGGTGTGGGDGMEGSGESGGGETGGGGSASLRACHRADLDSCLQFTGSGYSEEEIAGSCSGDLAEACPLTNAYGRCTANSGTESEAAGYYYTGNEYPEDGSPCVANGDVWEAL